MWGLYGIFLACRVKEPNGAEAAFRKSIELTPDTAVMRNLGVLLYCQLDREDEGVEFIRQACQLDGDDPVPESLARAILAACLHGSGRADNSVALPVEDLREASRWDELGDLCKEYAPFGKILHSLCVLVEKEDVDNRYAPLWRASALAQLEDFPRAIVALQDALVGDPVDLLSWGRNAVEIILAAAVRHARVGDCLEVIEKLGWIDAWRPIYEALRAVESGSADHLKRVAVEIHEPAKSILLRIAPDLPGQEPVSTGE
jgi:tetratricopeptide (TPR) repeat protein